jgi:hypothetical protein
VIGLYLVSVLISFWSLAAWYYLEMASSSGHIRLRSVAEFASLSFGFIVIGGSIVLCGELFSALFRVDQVTMSDGNWRDATFVFGSVCAGTLMTIPLCVGAEKLGKFAQVRFPLNVTDPGK